MYLNKIHSIVFQLFLLIPTIDWSVFGMIITSNSSCIRSMPFQATRINETQKSCSWKCNDGFYVTPSNTTCRPCSDPTQVAKVCSPGFQVAECLWNVDAKCKPCSSQNSISEVFKYPNNCSYKVCAPGYTSSWTSQCSRCPVDHFCPELIENENLNKSTSTQCPGNCTTAGRDTVSTQLMCSLPSPELGDHVIFSVEFNVYIFSTYIRKLDIPTDRQCYILDSTMYNLLEYGSLLECTVDPTLLISYYKVQCQISIDKCMGQLNFLTWLKFQLNTLMFSKLVPAILRCFSQSALVHSKMQISKPYIAELMTLSGEQYARAVVTYRDKLKWQLPPEKVPSIVHENEPWPKNQNQILEITFFVFVILFFLSLSFLYTCAFCCIRWRTSIFLKTVYRDIELQHKKYNKN